jgi:hypothetical protein
MFRNILLDLDEVNGRVVFLQPLLFLDYCRPSNGKTGPAALYGISADHKWRYDVSIALYFGYAQGTLHSKPSTCQQQRRSGLPRTQLPLLASTLIESAERPARRGCTPLREGRHKKTNYEDFR